MFYKFLKFFLKNGFSRSKLILKNKIYSIFPSYFNSNKIIKYKEKNILEPIFLRIGTADIGTFIQIFVNKEYDFVTKYQPKVIIDAGANIGLASIYFANKYPIAKIIAIEPEKNNYQMLEKNVEKYKNIIPLQSALWHKNESIRLVDTGLGTDSFITQKNDEINSSFQGVLSHLVNKNKYSSVYYHVPGMSMDKILKDYGLQEVDILKIDIEGAEQHVFDNSADTWIHKINSIVIEVDKDYPFMTESIFKLFERNKLSFKTYINGENLVFVKKGFDLTTSSIEFYQK